MKNSLTPYFGGSRSLKVIDVGTPESSSAVLVTISKKSVPICNLSHARRVNSCKITISKGGTLLWSPRSRGISSPRGTKFGHSALSYGENQESLSHLDLNRYRVVRDGQTDGRTDGITIASTHCRAYNTEILGYKFKDAKIARSIISFSSKAGLWNVNRGPGTAPGCTFQTYIFKCLKCKAPQIRPWFQHCFRLCLIHTSVWTTKLQFFDEFFLENFVTLHAKRGEGRCPGAKPPSKFLSMTQQV